MHAAMMWIKSSELTTLKLQKPTLLFKYKDGTPELTLGAVSEVFLSISNWYSFAIRNCPISALGTLKLRLDPPLKDINELVWQNFYYKWAVSDQLCNRKESHLPKAWELNLKKKPLRLYKTSFSSLW